MWEYRPTAAMLENRGQPTESATAENRDQPMRDDAVEMTVQPVEDTVVEDNTMQHHQEDVDAEHLGSFHDVTLFAGFDHGLHTSPRHPSLSQITANPQNIPAACPNEPAKGPLSNQYEVSLPFTFPTTVICSIDTNMFSFIYLFSG